MTPEDRRKEFLGTDASSQAGSKIERMARTFAMEYLTGHYRQLREDEQKQFDQLTVVLLAFAANIRPHQVARLSADTQALREELKKARYLARVLASAWEHDARPPTDVVKDALEFEVDQR